MGTGYFYNRKESVDLGRERLGLDGKCSLPRVNVVDIFVNDNVNRIY